MKGINQPHRSQQGSVLLAVLGFLFLATGLVASILVLSSSARIISQGQANMEQAMYVAEGGMERGLRFLESNIVAIVTSATGATNGSGSLGAGTYSFSVTRSNATTYSLVSTGTVNGVSRTVSLLRIYQPTYAEFALWSNTNGPIYFKDGEVFYGHIHANDPLYFDNSGGGPVFHSAVTSLATSIGSGTSSTNGIQFDEGLTLGSYQGTMADVDFNSAASTSLKNVAQSVGLVLSGNSTITFNGSTLQITNDRQGWTNYVYTFTSTNGIIYVENATSGTTATRPGTIYLNGGNLTGRLTIVAESNMWVQGHITYTTDPQVDPSSADALGLISRYNVWVNTNAPNNLTIQAAIMAPGPVTNSTASGSFGVFQYNQGSPRGTLTVYGGIVQNVRGAVGTFSGMSTTHGYTKHYSYDPRFIDNPPPFYPTVSSQVRFSQWREGH